GIRNAAAADGFLGDLVPAGQDGLTPGIAGVVVGQSNLRVRRFSRSGKRYGSARYGDRRQKHLLNGHDVLPIRPSGLISGVAPRRPDEFDVALALARSVRGE